MDWKQAAKQAYEHFYERERTFSPEESISVIDYFATNRSVTASDLQGFGSADFIGTILGHVTTAVHGGRSVPKLNGWYTHEGTNYVIQTNFADAWLALRRI